MSVLRAVLRPVRRRLVPAADVAALRMIEARIAADPAAAAYLATMPDSSARAHFGGEDEIGDDHLRLGVRYFHAWRVARLRQRIPAIADASFLDVGDSDGLMLRALEKTGTAVNVLPAAVDLIRANGVDAILGDGAALPFADRSFDYVLCFQTLEHVENPHGLLCELGRVARAGVFVSIPGVTATGVVPRDPAVGRGAEHCVEFSRDDFCAFVSHSPLTVVWDDVCELFLPRRPIDRLRVAAAGNGRAIFAGTFARFRMFELTLPPV